MDKNKIMYQIFIGKVSEIIGFDRTYELLKESKESAEVIEKELKL